MCLTVFIYLGFLIICVLSCPLMLVLLNRMFIYLVLLNINSTLSLSARKTKKKERKEKELDKKTKGKVHYLLL
jgi:hypothetical protein